MAPIFPFDLSIAQFEIDGNMMFCCTMHDASERNTAITYRERLIEKLTKSNVKLERFAYVASHDMQETLRTMNRFSDLVLSDTRKISTRKERHTSILSAMRLRACRRWWAIYWSMPTRARELRI